MTPLTKTDTSDDADRHRRRPAAGRARPAGLRRAHRGRRAGPRRRRRHGHGGDRAERLRQVHPAARARPAAQADRRARCCSTASASTRCPPGRSPRSSGCCRRRRSRPRGSPWPTWSPAAGTRTRPGTGSGRPTTRRPWPQALEWTGIADLAERPVDELSGGQRQRAWISMALAQGTDLLLLDEPTTFLDLAHQVDVLELVRRLHREAGRTVVMVLHDLNLAARYADRLIAMRDGRIVAAGEPGGRRHRGDARRGVRARRPGDRRPGGGHAARRPDRRSRSVVLSSRACHVSPCDPATAGNEREEAAVDRSVSRTPCSTTRGPGPRPPTSRCSTTGASRSSTARCSSGPGAGPQRLHAIERVRAAVAAALPDGLRVQGPVPLRLGPDCVLMPDLIVTAAAAEPAADEATTSAEDAGDESGDADGRRQRRPLGRPPRTTRRPRSSTQPQR